MKEYPRPPFLSAVNVTASRSKNTDYTNNTGKVMLVMISFQALVTVAGGSAYATLSRDGGAVQYGGIAAAGAVNERKYWQLVQCVLPGSVYRFEDWVVNGTITIENWTEVY